MEQPTAPKTRRGCYFYGCIAGVVVLVAILLGGLLGLHLFKKALNQYTDTQPQPLPALELSPIQIEQVQRRVDIFQDAVSTGRPTPPLELSGAEINGLISTNPELSGAKDKARVQMEGDKLRAQVSVPMEQIGLSAFRGRYLNGEITLSIALDKGFLRVSPVEVDVKGKPLPSVYLQKLRGLNLAAGANENSKASIALNRLESITVKDGKLVLVPKQEK